MKICTAQLRPLKGDITGNTEKHRRLIELAARRGAELIFFPELSLSGYEPELAKDLATTSEDTKLDVFQQLSDELQIVICLGLPTKSDQGIHISMIIFQPLQARQTYSKQQLHADELPFFVNGQGQVLLHVNKQRLAPAICYESLQPTHAEQAVKQGATLYMASVAKSANGVAKAQLHYPSIAKHYNMPVLMSNCVGFCDNFESVGQSAIWNRKGELVARLGETEEGILIFDTDTEALLDKQKLPAF